LAAELGEHLGPEVKLW